MIVGTKVFYQVAWIQQKGYPNALEQSNHLCKEFDLTISMLRGWLAKGRKKK